MTTITETRDTLELLSANQLRNDLVANLKELKTLGGKLSQAQVITILGQWFHPLHYFPVFLSRLIACAPNLETQTFVSRILWQELGEGDPQNAHEEIYIQTIQDSGFDSDRVSKAVPFDATCRLIEGYQKSSEHHLSGLGFMYGTEVVDLPMVATIGHLMRHCTGKHNLPWVNVHVAQEPHHVESSNQTLANSFTEEEQEQVVKSAEEMWRLWNDFFTTIKYQILQ